MKKILLLCFITCTTATTIAQQRNHSTFYHQRASLFEKLPVTEKDILFVGNSITNGGEWAELFNDPRIKNRGISGDICEGILDRLAPLLRGKPAKIFLLIGINDLARNTSPDTVVSMTADIVNRIRCESPRTAIYLQSILPVNDCYGMFEGHTRHGRAIASLNERLKEIATSQSIIFVDLYSHFIIPGSDKLDPRYSNDGLHLMGEGYLKWVEILKPYL
ncbi:GDSL-type esterase/lipase family protein [uncultured Proteiniphilum sp.]|jgi:lysophospholipase L1-like esterase|uniref:GDSL-type esterase/lipase family protein n=1 Tax=uncultured Proteiniphilum sp. TaxID=497637 RepID=UPI002627D583|nr:GDSL-type esterase/lipase family protein [uncultured Proteiniphilum sp.]